MTTRPYVAAVTKRIRLATGVIVLSYRKPIDLAKEPASLDILSGGRLVVGVASGWLESEFRALNAPYPKTRSVRGQIDPIDAHLVGLRLAIVQGRFVDLAACDSDRSGRRQDARAGAKARRRLKASTSSSTRFTLIQPLRKMCRLRSAAIASAAAG